MRQSREETERRVEALYTQIGEALSSLDGKRLDAQRDEIRGRLKDFLALAESPEYTEALSLLDDEGYAEYEKVLKGLYFKMTLGRDADNYYGNLPSSPLFQNTSGYDVEKENTPAKNSDNQVDNIEQAELSDIVNRINAEVDRAAKIFEKIATMVSETEINTDRENGIFTQVEKGLQSVADSVKLLNWLTELLPFFPNASEREHIYEFIETAQKLFRNVDLSDVRSGITDNVMVTMRNNIAPFSDMATSARNLSGVIEPKVENRDETGSASEEERTSLFEKLQELWETVLSFMDWLGLSVKVFDAQINFQKGPVKATFNPLSLDIVTVTNFEVGNNDLELKFKWNPKAHEILGGANFRYNPVIAKRNTELDLKMDVKYSDENGFGLALAFAPTIDLTRLTTLQLGISTNIVGANPSVSLKAGVRTETQGGSFSVGGALGVSAGRISNASFFTSGTIGSSGNWHTIFTVPFYGNSESKCEILVGLRF